MLALPIQSAIFWTAPHVLPLAVKSPGLQSLKGRNQRYSHDEDLYPDTCSRFVSSVSAQAYEPSAEVKADVVQSLAEIGCTSDDIEVEGNGYKANDAKCGTGGMT